MRRFFFLFAFLLALLIPVESVAAPFAVLHKRGSAWSGGGSSTFYPGAGGDDYSWSDLAFQKGNSWVGFGGHDRSYHAGFRFSNVTIPQGATIITEYLGGPAYNDGTNDPVIYIYGNDTNDAVLPTSVNECTELVHTTAMVEWNPTVWTAGTVYTTPELKTIIQEIVDRGDWESGNHMQILLIDQTGSQLSHNRNYCGIEYEYGAKKVGLYVEWE